MALVVKNTGDIRDADSTSGLGSGYGNPLQYTCLENPMDQGAWWAAIYGVAQGRPQLNHLAAAVAAAAVHRYQR